MDRRRLALGALAAALLVGAGVLIGILVSAGETDPPAQASPIPMSTVEPTPGTREAQVFLTREDEERCDRVFGVPRTVRADAPVPSALTELLAGPTSEEEAQGYTSWFSEETDGMLRDVETSRGVTRVDFEDFSGIIPNASTSCGSAALLEQLERTVEQFPDVLRAVYSFEGDPEAFYGWLQLAVPEAPSCSAAETTANIRAESGLPDAVHEMRLEILRQAVTCDYEDLEWLATRDVDEDFTFSFGGGEGAAAFWHRAEEEGREPMRFLVRLLVLPHAELDDGTFVWPSAFAYDAWEDVPPEDREALEPLYGPDDFQGFAELGAYLGYRVGIAPDGDWLFFVEGD